jgi:hypothetical protein
LLVSAGFLYRVSQILEDSMVGSRIYGYGVRCRDIGRHLTRQDSL